MSEWGEPGPLLVGDNVPIVCALCGAIILWPEGNRFTAAELEDQASMHECRP